MDYKKIQLHGPGNSILKIKPKQNIPVLSFSTSLQWFYNNKKVPEYWTFVDPTTAEYFFNKFQNECDKDWLDKLKNETTLLYIDIYKDNRLYKSGLKTKKGQDWLTNKFQKSIFPKFKDYFKESKELKTNVVSNAYFLIEENGLDKNYYIKHEKFNNDKFTCFCLPMIFYYFKDIKEIYSLGFGDFGGQRAYIKNAHGYRDFKRSFDSVYRYINFYMFWNDIKIKFLNENSYYNKFR